MSKKMIALFSTLGVLLVTGLILVGSYNGLVSKDESVKNANSKIEIALQRRGDLVPNVVSSVKGYMKHEKEIFENIANARAKIGSNNKNGLL